MGYSVFLHACLQCMFKFVFCTYLLHQGRSQELEMGGAKILGEGSGGHLRPPVGPGLCPGRGTMGEPPPPPEALGF